MHRAEENVLGGALVELTILLSATHHQTTKVLSEAAALYKVDTGAIGAKVKQEFAARDKAKDANNAAAKQLAEAAKKSSADYNLQSDCRTGAGLHHRLRILVPGPSIRSRSPRLLSEITN